jgi:hypothetical protein
VDWWTERYTRGLPADVRDARRAEIASDVFEQCHGAANGDVSHRAVAWRTVRGVHADLAWRRQEQQRMQASLRPPSRIRSTWAVVTQNWFAPLAVLVGVFNLGFAIAVARVEGDSASGRVVGPILLAAATVSLATGLWLRWRTGQALRLRPERATPAAVPARWLTFLVALPVVLLALVALAFGIGSAVPIAVAFAVAVLAVVGGGIRLVARAAATTDAGTRIVLADGLIVLGMLPALAMFWMVIPPLLAIAVIVGLVTTNPRVRSAA